MCRVFLLDAQDTPTLAGCKFCTYEIRALEFNFYDSVHCECTQYFRIPLPNDNYVVVDTLEYQIEGYKVIFINPSATAECETKEKKITDYYSLSFLFSTWIQRDGQVLDEYPIKTRSAEFHSFILGEAHWIEWGYRTEFCVLEYPKVMLLANAILYLVEGTPNMQIRQKDDVPSEFHCQFMGLTYPCGEAAAYRFLPEYKWFTRERLVLPTVFTKAEVTHRHFIHQYDTIFFENDSVCKICVESSQRECSYDVDGANVLIFGLDVNCPSKADTLIYSDRVLYHACVTQTRMEPDSTYKTPFYIGPRRSIEQLQPSAQMRTCAFVRDQELVSDEQIGTTFQRFYMPINFHANITPL